MKSSVVDLLHDFCWWKRLTKSGFVEQAIQEKLDREIADHGQPPAPHSADIPWRGR